jgi:hypothetical protein
VDAEVAGAVEIGLQVEDGSDQLAVSEEEAPGVEAAVLVVDSAGVAVLVAEDPAARGDKLNRFNERLSNAKFE